MALDALGNDPCSRLNVASYPDLWIRPNASESDTYRRIAVNGTTISMLQMLRGKILTGDVLQSRDTNNSYRLIQFLSGGGVAGSPYGSLGSIVLGTEKSPETIVDTYFGGIGSYNSAVSETKLSSTLANLQTNGYLLKESDIYSEAQLTTSDKVPLNSQTLLYLYKTEQSSPLTGAQTKRKQSLEATNLRFFGAFLAEYCYYRTRYQWLLQKYFDTYKQSTTTFVAPVRDSPVFSLFQTSPGTGENQAANLGQVTQPEMLKAMAFHMANINNRMTDMRRLLGIINNEYNRIFKLIQENINNKKLVGSNSDLTQTVTALKDSAKEAKQYMSEAQFSQRAVEYTQEKNRHATILLGLYAVLNVAALAMIYKLK
jgi:hypothetical protein